MAALVDSPSHKALTSVAKRVSVVMKLGGGDIEDDDQIDPLADASPTIKVCVRVRPFIKEEIEGSRSDGETVLCIEMPTKTSVVMLHRTPEPKHFEFDRTYWSHDEDHPLYANQDTLYEELGKGMLQQALKGFNNCIFAYGQTGSGKSFSVLGGKTPELQGLLPRIVTGLFERFADMEDYHQKKCTVSFIEIYNEQIMDLLVSPDSASEQHAKLEVRQHPVLGTFIPGLTEPPVFSKEEVITLVDYGATMRHVSATAMNATSSRSHCIFTFKTSITKAAGMNAASSQTHLVDLAGSERAGRTKAEGARLKEGAAINQSLSTLARVISELAKLSQKGGKKKKVNIPFRDSKITYILKEALSGNSKTVMMAAISPNLLDYEETMSTIKFCQTVKMVQTSAKQNQVNEKGLEAQLKNELEALREQLQKCEAERDTDHRKLSAALKQVEVHKDLVSRNSMSSWESRRETEKQRQSKREGIIIHPEQLQSPEFRSQMSMLSCQWSDVDQDSVWESSSDWEDNSSDEFGDKVLQKYAKVEELGRRWELKKTIAEKMQSPQSPVSYGRDDSLSDDQDSDGQSSAQVKQEQVEVAKDAYEESLRQYRAKLSHELEKLSHRLNDVDDRWAAVGGKALPESVPKIRLARTATDLSAHSVVKSIPDETNLSLLQNQANNVKRAVDAISSEGAPQVTLRVMVAVDPSGGSNDVCIQACTRSAAIRSDDDENVEKGEEVHDTLQWLTVDDLNQRWAWLEERCEEAFEADSRSGMKDKVRTDSPEQESVDLHFDFSRERTPEQPNCANDEAVTFVPKDGRTYADPWKEMNTALLRKTLRMSSQKMAVIIPSASAENRNAEKRDEANVEGAQSRQDKRPKFKAGSLGIEATFEEATCNIDMAQALLQSLRRKREEKEKNNLGAEESKIIEELNLNQKFKKAVSRVAVVDKWKKAPMKQVLQNEQAALKRPAFSRSQNLLAR